MQIFQFITLFIINFSTALKVSLIFSVEFVQNINNKNIINKYHYNLNQTFLDFLLFFPFFFLPFRDIFSRS